jgi:hypothetical protein
VNIDENVRMVMKHLAECCSDYYKYMTPVFKADSRGVPYHAGTCFGLEVRGRHFLLTASHVLDKDERNPEDSENQIFVAVNGTIQNSLKFRRWNLHIREDNDIEGETVDLVVLEPIDLDAGAIVGDFFPRASIFRPPLTERYYVAALGFPETANEIQWGTNTVSNVPMSFCGFVSPTKKCLGLGFPEQSHFCFEFNFKKGYRAEGSRVNPTNPEGISGGPVLVIHDFDSPHEKQVPQLCGVTIEKRKKEKSIVCVRIDQVIRELEGFPRNSGSP